MLECTKDYLLMQRVYLNSHSGKIKILTMKKVVTIFIYR